MKQNKITIHSEEDKKKLFFRKVVSVILLLFFFVLLPLIFVNIQLIFPFQHPLMSFLLSVLLDIGIYLLLIVLLVLLTYDYKNNDDFWLDVIRFFLPWY